MLKCLLQAVDCETVILWMTRKSHDNRAWWPQNCALAQAYYYLFWRPSRLK